MSKDQPNAPEGGGKGGGVEGTNIFMCPECDEEHAFPGYKPGEPLMCPKCEAKWIVKSKWPVK